MSFHCFYECHKCLVPFPDKEERQSFVMVCIEIKGPKETWVPECFACSKDSK